MSISLNTRSASVVNGRCTGCGRFIRPSESHFHSPPRKFRGRPRVHLFDWNGDEGGMVTRCDDPEVASPLIIAKYLRENFGSLIDDEDREQARRLFDPSKGQVQRGRVNVIAPEADDYSWWWMRLGDDAKGHGVTTAVVWSP